MKAAWFCSLRTFACLGLLSITSAVGQTKPDHIELLVFNGKTGKPMANQRTLIFLESAPDSAAMRKAIAVYTDARGAARFPLLANHQPFLQVWVDQHTLCQNHPNTNGYSIDKLLSSGLQTPNDCGSISISVHPGQIAVYARQGTWRERMAQ